MPLSLKLGPKSFARYAAILCGLWLLLILPLLNWFCWEKLPECIRSGHGDFEQYYSGGLVARHGLWDQLYPVAKPNYQQIRYAADLYPEKTFPALQIASAQASAASPQLLAYCPTLAKHCHYIYPPPLALYLSPLGCFGYDTSRKIWFELMCGSIFGATWVSGRITRKLWGRVTYVEGSLFLMVFTWTLLGNSGSSQLSEGNVSPFLGLLIALIAYAWIHGRNGVIGLLMILLLPFKGIGLSWCPLLLFKPAKWKALAIMAGLTMLLNGAALWMGGVAVYRRFFTEILPYANIAVGIGLQRRTLLFFGNSFQNGYLMVNFALLGGLYWGWWRQRHSPERLRPSLAMFAGTTALFCLLNPVVWVHYLPHYVLIPFFGWVVWEICHCPSRLLRNLMWMMFLANLFFIIESPVLLLQGPSGRFIRIFVEGLVADLSIIQPVFVLILAFRRLFAGNEGAEPTNAPEDSSATSAKLAC